MPAKDLYHNTVKIALRKDSWIITHDPLLLQWGGKDLLVDLGAEKIIAAEKDQQKIAVEIKSFRGSSQVNDLEKNVGQYIIYRNILEEVQPQRILYLAITKKAYDDIFLEPLGQLVFIKNNLKLLIFNDKNEEIIRWIN